MDPNTEIRKLRPGELCTLARILATSDSWKTLMAVVPKEGTENDPKFNAEHFALIERASCQQRKSGAEIFLEEWSTMGKRRPTLKSTLDLLVRVQLFRAADYIAVDLLQTQPPERPTCGPAAPIDISDEEIAKLIKRTSSEFEIPDSRIFNSEKSLDSVLNGISYPSQLSVQDSLQQQQQVQHERVENNSNPQAQPSGSEFIAQISTMRINAEETSQNNSNLMQFSKSDVESRQNVSTNSTRYNNSNLMQFSSHSTSSISEAMNVERNFAFANGARIANLRDNASLVPPQREIVYITSSDYESREENVRVEENGVELGNTETRESSDTTSNNEFISNSNNCNEFELQSSELPAFVADMGRGSTLSYNELKSSELPQFVAEIAHQKSNASDSQEAFGEPTLSTNSASSDASSNLLTNVTSSSAHNTASDIPLCVNLRSGNFEDNELVSAELPQFVADLGHRRNNDTSEETIAELSDRSSNDHTDQFGSSNASTDQYLGLASQELPLVVSECNRMRGQYEDNPRELMSAELPQFVVELQNVVLK